MSRFILQNFITRSIPEPPGIRTHSVGIKAHAQTWHVDTDVNDTMMSA